MDGLGKGLTQNINDYKIEGLISSIWDGRGRVVAATHIPTSAIYTVKVFDLEKCSEDFDLIQHEARMLREVRHPNLCSIVCSFSIGQEAWLLLPQHLCSVATLLNTSYSTGLPELAIALVVRDVLQALVYLHNRGIIHRAIQARHILVSGSGTAVLCGLRHSVHHTSAGVGADGGLTLHAYPLYPAPLLNWASPEMLHQDLRGYSYSSDVYSLGLTVCEMANAEEPYNDLPATLMMVEKLRGFVPCLHDASNMCAQDYTTDTRSSNNSLASNGGLHISPTSNNSNNTVVGLDDTALPHLSSSTRLAAHQQRHLTAAAHEFVRRTLALQPDQRPTARQLLQGDAFVRQARKVGSGALGLISLLLITIRLGAVRSDDTTTRELESKLSQVSIEDTSWSFDK